jgi:phenylpyruvate tautomerase PptA (4-oxalocrotonate tautomerase family)
VAQKVFQCGHNRGFLMSKQTDANNMVSVCFLRKDTTSMPTIVITYPQRAIPAHQQTPLLAAATKALVRWEGIKDPEDPQSGATVWTYLQPIPEGFHAVNGTPAQAGPQARFLIEVSVPEGIVTGERKQGLIAELTQAVLAAAEAPDDPRQAGRVYCLIYELGDGNWGARGQSAPLRVMLATAGIAPESERYAEVPSHLR